MTSETWRPTATVATLARRGEIIWTIRNFFHERHFIEVQPPVIGHDTVVDLNIEPIQIQARFLACAAIEVGEVEDEKISNSGDLYLQTSPEFSMKRLLAAGMKAIYNIGPVFRAGERGANHNPEFSMLEWYRVGDGFVAGIAFLDQLIQAVLPSPSAEISTYQNVFLKYAHCDPLVANVSELAQIAVNSKLGVGIDWSEDRDTWLDLLFSELVQPKLGLTRPMIVTHYPATQSALALISSEDERTAERYELFVDGIELANGYHELLDADELLVRNQRVASQRLAANKPALPISSRLMAAMRSGIPACCGCALGLDRLIMVATGSNRIDQVMPFPIERA
jgi:elongation factor P--(R)-beta-lysine ligase